MATPYVLIRNRSNAVGGTRTQEGSVSIEFVLMFPALFLILYAIVTYSLVFGAQQTLTLAAAEGGRAALRYQRMGSTGATVEERQMAALALREQAAMAAASSMLSRLHGAVGEDKTTVTASSTDCSPAGGASVDAPYCLTVSVVYRYSTGPLIPPLLGPLLSFPVPDILSSESVVQLSPSQLL